MPKMCLRPRLRPDPAEKAYSAPLAGFKPLRGLLLRGGKGVERSDRRGRKRESKRERKGKREGKGHTGTFFPHFEP